MNRLSTLASMATGLTLALATASAPAGQIIFVDDDRPTNGDGQSWATAYRYLQDALTAARDSGGTITEVWVAAGTYYPDRDAEHPNGTLDQNASFEMIEGVALRGGFAGDEDPATFDLATRDFGAHTATLSGDLLDNDPVSYPVLNDNSNRVVTADAVGASAILDGFTVTGADGEAAVRCSSASPTILNNTITGNVASGVYCVFSSPTIAHNIISENMGSGCGGGIYSHSGSPLISNNVISGNGIRRSSIGSPITRDGGGVCCWEGSPVITKNLIVENVAAGSESEGGGIHCRDASVTISNNVIVGNVATGTPPLYPSQGGGIGCSGGSAVISNNTIVSNTSDQGGGIFCNPSFQYSIANNIVAFNSSGIFGYQTAVLTHNCVYNPGGEDYSVVGPGEGDISVDPQFLGAEYLDFHLLAGSPCIDAGDNAVVQPDATDLDGEPRIQADQVDIGTDEFNGTAPTITPKAIRVSPLGNDDNDGCTWATAKRTIQKAIDVALSSDSEIWVVSGTYREQVTLKAGVSLYGGFGGDESQRNQRNWHSHVSVLDGTGEVSKGSVVSVWMGSRRTRIDGFTIRGGSGTYYSTRELSGGGIFCGLYASPTIANCTITGNSASGGGIFCDNGSPLIMYCTIMGNTGGGIVYASGTPIIVQNKLIGNTGGGISNNQQIGSGAPVITGNLIQGNTADSGAGICCYSTYGALGASSSGMPIITNNVIANNTATVGDGGGICCLGQVKIANNTIVGNSGTLSGGIYCTEIGTIVSNNTIVGNSARSSRVGGGISTAGTAIISNNIIAFNSGGLTRPGGTPTLRHNCVYNPDGTNYFNFITYPISDGDISVDPRFLAPERGDFHLLVGSPCIDAGYDTSVDPSWMDLDGQARLQGAHVDIGADEFTGATPHFAPPAIRVSLAGDDANDGLTWATAKRTVTGGINAAAFIFGSEVWVAAGTYDERITLQPWVYVLGGFSGIETTRDQRDWTSNVTILDGGAAGSVVTATAPGRNSGIEGFTIRNGSGYLPPSQGAVRYGGGIFCSNSSPLIAHNIITANRADYGGGVFCTPTSASSAAAPTITDNTFTANTASFGGAICCLDGATPAITGNIITANGPTGSSCLGGGIYCRSAAPTLTGNVITLNSAGTGQGGGIHLELPTFFVPLPAPSVIGNTLAGNTAAIGGGAYVHGMLTPTFANDLFIGNRASTRGGGLSAYANVTAVNCTFIANTAPSAAAAHAVLGSTMTLTNNIFWGNVGPLIQGSPVVTYCDVEGGWTGTGNFNLDPRFARLPSSGPDGVWATADDDYGDLHLLRGSPCIDTGKNAALPVGVLTDRDGHPRFVDDPDVADCTAAPGTCGSGPLVDLGAYELLDGDFNGDGQIDLADFGAFFACFSGPAVPSTVACASADFDADTDVDQTDFGSLQRRMLSTH